MSELSLSFRTSSWRLPYPSRSINTENELMVFSVPKMNELADQIRQIRQKLVNCLQNLGEIR